MSSSGIIWRQEEEDLIVHINIDLLDDNDSERISNEQDHVFI